MWLFYYLQLFAKTFVLVCWKLTFSLLISPYVAGTSCAALPDLLLISDISLISSLHSATPVNDPDTCFKEKRTFDISPSESSKVLSYVVLNSLTQCYVASRRIPKVLQISSWRYELFLSVSSDRCAWRYEKKTQMFISILSKLQILFLLQKKHNEIVSFMNTLNVINQFLPYLLSLLSTPSAIYLFISRPPQIWEIFCKFCVFQKIWEK